MGVFYEQVELVNRAPVNLTVTFDGQCKTLVPGVNHVPRLTVQYAMNQNPIMGTGDPNNPHISGAKYLLGVAADGDDVTPLTPEEWTMHLGRPCRMDDVAAFEERYGSDPKARQVVLGKGRKTAANSRYEAGGAPQSRGNVESAFVTRE